MKKLSIAEVEQQPANTPIWGVNTAPDSEIGVAGEIHISIPKVNGTKSDSLHIPQTWLAIELTASIPRAQLLAASEFRSALQSQLLTLVDAKTAARINSQDGAEEERQRLIEFRRHIRTAGAARTISQGAGEVKMVSAPMVDDDSGEKVEVKAALSDSFLMFAERIANQSDIEALNAIRSRKTFTRKEILHLKKTLIDKPKSLAAIAKFLDRSKAKAA